MIELTTPFTKEKARMLKAGDQVLLSGVIYTGRDAAHKRLVDALEHNLPLPFDPMDAIIYFVGPAPAAPGEIIGSCGPTTSYRMDAYSPKLLSVGLRGMIGLGTEAIRRLVVKDMPLTVVIDSKGRDLYKIGKEKYLHYAHED